jgi:hypothetical protein
LDTANYEDQKATSATRTEDKTSEPQERDVRSSAEELGRMEYPQACAFFQSRLRLSKNFMVVLAVVVVFVFADNVSSRVVPLRRDGRIFTQNIHHAT